MFLRAATAIIASLGYALGCERLELTSSYFPKTYFYPLSASQSHELGFRSGRTTYISELEDGKSSYLYHTIASPYSDGVGRWVISDVPGSNDEAQAFIDTWAVTPYLIHAVNDPSKSTWKVATTEEFVFDQSLQIHCVPTHGREDNTIYLEVRDTPFFLSGFYVQVQSISHPIFSHVRSDSDAQYYLYKSENRWIIGEEPESPTGVAYVFDNATYPGDITSTNWHYSINSDWITIPTTIIKGDQNFNIYGNLRTHRYIPGVDGRQSLRRLRNDLPIPAVGLGTASISFDLFQQVAEYALLHGYRLFDLAREFKNEALLAELLHNPALPKRNEVFIISKVWPTHLGYDETTYEITQSLKAFQDPYIDLYMIHWPRCDSNIEWMHCQDTMNPHGNLLQSYKSLERAYAEGRIGAIGVSNVNAHELDEISLHSTISPHAVQNFAIPGNLDMDVRIWCFDHHAAYFPTAYQRNVASIPDEGKELLGHIAYNHGVNEHLVMTRFFLQTGAIVTPGSSHPDHLIHNLEVESFLLSESEMNALGWPSKDPSTYHPGHEIEL